MKLIKASDIDIILASIIKAGKRDYAWNPAYNFVMKIKNDYINMYGNIDTYSIKEMCQKLNTPEYNNFLKCVKINVYGSLNLFKYNLIGGGEIDLYDNPKSIYREMRSLVIDIATDDIVLCPFKKFFNINEIENETSLDIVLNKIKKSNTVEITDKLDGSMQSARYYNGEYIMSGSNALNSDNSEQLTEGKSWLSDNYKKLLRDYADYTFVFEYISLKDAHVVKYTKEQQGLYLIGCRNVYTGKQLSYKELQDISIKYDIPSTSMETKSFNDVLNSLDDYKGTDKEGWVLNIDGEQFKLKTTDYLAMHHYLYVSPNVILQSISDGTFDDVLSKIPIPMRDDVYEIRDNILKYIKYKNEEIEYYFNTVKDINDRKEFALVVNETIPPEYKGYMFSLFNNKDLNVLKNVKYNDILEYINNYQEGVSI